MNLANVLAWGRQPSTVVGIATLAGTATAYFGGSLSITAAVPVAVGGLVSVLLPDNSKAAADAQAAAAAAIVAASARNPATISAAVQGLVRVAGDLEPGTPVVPVVAGKSAAGAAS